MDHFKKFPFLTRSIIEHLVKMVTLIKRTNQKNHVSFMPLVKVNIFLVNVNILLVNVNILVKSNLLKNRDFL